MSRSFRHTPIKYLYCGEDRPGKGRWAKRWAAKKVRRYAGHIADGAAYRYLGGVVRHYLGPISDHMERLRWDRDLAELSELPWYRVVAK